MSTLISSPFIGCGDGDFGERLRRIGLRPCAAFGTDAIDVASITSMPDADTDDAADTADAHDDGKYLAVDRDNDDS